MWSIFSALSLQVGIYLFKLIFRFLKNINNKKLISEFIAKAFNDECHVRDREITLEQSTLIKNHPKPSNILLLDKALLEKVGIKVRKIKFIKRYNNRYGEVAKFNIGIYSKKNLNNFYKNINLIKHKKLKLKNYLVRTGETT